MSQYDKVEVVDFLINVLKEHEKSLDVLISRAEDVMAESEENPKSTKSGPHESPRHKIILKEWSDFRKRLMDVDLVCFDLINSVFVVSASMGLKIYEYKEALPSDIDTNRGKGTPQTYRLSIGLDVFVKNVNEEELGGSRYEVEHHYTRGWLSRELNIPQDYIVCGELEL